MNLHVLTYNVFGMPWGLCGVESILLWVFYDTDAEVLCFQEVFSQSEKQKIQEICSRKHSQWNCWFPEAEPTCLSRLTSYFSSITGLCILTKKNIHLEGKPFFQQFENNSCVDQWVRKGFFHIPCKKDGVLFHLITTHFQSDFTECKCRIRYQPVRDLQERQLYNYCKAFQNMILVGDINMSKFRYFEPVNQQLEITLEETGEALDHCLRLPSQPHVSCEEVKYFHTIALSDHIPVLFHLRFGPI
jgi:exonuclease III